MLVTLTSISGSPGVSTTGLGITLTGDPTRIMYVEADPIGSSATLAGYLHASRRHDRSIVQLVEPNRHGQIGPAFHRQVLPIGPADGGRGSTQPQGWFVPNLVNAAQAESMKSTWGPLGAHLAQLSKKGDVIVDAGRLNLRSGHQDLMRHSDVIVVMLKPTRTSVAAVRAGLGLLRQHLEATKSPASLGLIVRGTEPYSASETAKVTGLDVIAVIPESPLHAQIFSDGASLSKWRRRRSNYLRAIDGTWSKIERFEETHKPAWLSDSPYTSQPA